MNTQGIAQNNKGLAERLDFLKQASIAVEHGKALTTKRKNDLTQAERTRQQGLERLYNVLIDRLVSMLPDEIKPFADHYISIEMPPGWNSWVKQECTCAFNVPGFAPMRFYVTARDFNVPESMLVDWYFGGERCVVSVLQTSGNRYNNIYEYDQDCTPAENVLMAFALAYQTGAQPEPVDDEANFSPAEYDHGSPAEKLVNALIAFIHAETGE